MRQMCRPPSEWYETLATWNSVADLRVVRVDGSVVRFRAWNGSEYAALVEEIVGPSVPASCGAQPEPQKALSARIL